MKTLELVQMAKASKKEAFGEVPDQRAVAMVNAVLAELRRQIRDSKEPVVVAGFGRFVVREGKVTKDGAEVAVRRIGFRPAAERKVAPAAAAEPRQAARAAKAARPASAPRAAKAPRARKAAAKKKA